MAGRLAGKVALITGAATGQGRAAALLFASEGAKVALADVNMKDLQDTVDLVRSRGGEVIPLHCDVSRENDVKKAVDDTVAAFGKLTTVYSNAGIAHKNFMISVEDLSLDEWEQVLSVNLRGTFLVAKYGIPELMKNGGGTIVTTASTAGLINSPGGPAYSASKGGVISFTRHLAANYAKKGIRVNTLAAGYVKTPLTKAMEELFPQLDQVASEGTPLGRGAEPEEVAKVALFLSSEESSFITGSVIVVDGGFTIV